MEFTAIAFKEQISLNLFELINSSFEKHGFIVSKEEKWDSEIQQGITSFLEASSLKTVLTIKYSEILKKETGFESISEELTEYFITQRKSPFLDLLVKNFEIFPQKYYVIFAFEWHQKDKIRFKKMNLHEFKNYFKENNSWYLWLYDYLNNFEQAELDIPIIFEIDASCHDEF